MWSLGDPAQDVIHATDEPIRTRLVHDALLRQLAEARLPGESERAVWADDPRGPDDDTPSLDYYVGGKDARR